MPSRSIAAIGVIVLTLGLAACGGSAASAPTETGAAGVSSPEVAAGVCASSTEAGAVAVSIKDFAFTPADISAGVDEVITFTNDDTVAHTASVTDGSCTTANLSNAESEGLVFSVAGSYPFRCNIHQQMTGTITIS